MADMTPTTGTAAARWGTLGLVAALATASGLVMPRLLGDPVVPRAPVVASEKGPAARGVHSADELKYQPPPAIDAPDTAAMFLRLGVVTAVVLGMAVGGLWAGHRWLGTVGPAGAAVGRRLRLVETLPLGSRCAVYLLQVDDRVVLAGVDSGGLQTLLPLHDGFDDALSAAQLNEPVSLNSN